MRYVAIALLAALAGCAGPGTEIQAQCETLHADFSPMYGCTRTTIAARSPGVMANARAKLDHLRGEQLAREVDERRLASLDAKVLWQELFVSLKTANDQEAAAAAESMTRRLEAIRAAYPVVTLPTMAPPRTVTCTSFGSGPTVETICR